MHRPLSVGPLLCINFFYRIEARLVQREARLGQSDVDMVILGHVTAIGDTADMDQRTVEVEAGTEIVAGGGGKVTATTERSEAIDAGVTVAPGAGGAGVEDATIDHGVVVTIGTDTHVAAVIVRSVGCVLEDWPPPSAVVTRTSPGPSRNKCDSSSSRPVRF